MRFLMLIGACGLLGCVSFPNAQLLHGTTTLSMLTGPVVCGPVGFRKVPLQARWGEYVRVTVAAKGSLRGTAVVHAGGVVQAEQSWSTASTGALVVEARFPNEDPDRRFVLERERPIDITLNNLEGGCEGAVFTVEHGALVPSIDEQAWVAELERRGGPELAARRELARVEADARREAHYALWESRQQVEVSAQLLAQAESIRQAHYAQWEATSVSLSPVGDRAFPGSELSVISSTAVGSASAGVAPTGCGGGGTMASVGVTQTGCGTIASAGVRPTVCGGGACGAIASSGVGAAVCPRGTCGAVAVTASEMNGGPGDRAVVSAVPMSTVTAPGEWTQPSDATLRANADVGAVPDASLRANGASESSWSHANGDVVAMPDASLRANGEVGSGWSQPSDATLRANADLVTSPDASPRLNGAVETRWREPGLEPVAVTTESRVAVSAAPPQVPSCNGTCAAPVDPAVFVVPAMFQLMFNVAGAAAQQPQTPVHGARPVGR